MPDDDAPDRPEREPDRARTVIDPGAARAALQDPELQGRRLAETQADPSALDPSGSGASAAHDSPALDRTRAASGDVAFAADSVDQTLVPGRKIRQYELIREVGRGGMGRVFLARDTVLGRKVAVKFLHRSSKALTDRFLVEARATARCEHENIVVIYEVNEYQGVPYMVLEYLDGESLRDLIPPQGVTAQRAVELVLPVVRALIRAHEFGFVHRDLKPENIFVRRNGTVKVLDFGIAKFYQDDAPESSWLESADLGVPGNHTLTRFGALVGTLAYMSPEQWGTDAVDQRTDLWAVGLILHELVTGSNPLSGLSEQELLTSAASLDNPLPSVSGKSPRIPKALTGIIDRCLAKRKGERFETAAELAAALEPLLPDRAARKRVETAGPYPGLATFEEEDAARFHGRSREIQQARNWLRDRPLVAVVGPSGVGKSSFVRAGLIPALKGSGTPWETHTLRPGRTPATALSRWLEPLLQEEAEPPAELAGDEAARLRGLAEAPGKVAELLRRRAQRLGGQVLVFADQCEELYTLGADAAERRTFARCLLALADDAGSPVRVVLSMRSDLLDRLAADPALLQEATRGLMMLQAPDREGMRAALVEPLQAAGYEFEEPALVEEMLDELEETPGSLPLLQFTASRLWEGRDQEQHLLTRESYTALGGVAGALATHADETYDRLTAPQQRVARRLLPHLVTSDATRAVVEVKELEALAGDSATVRAVLDRLVDARLLTTRGSSQGAGRTVELVHESLITNWPALRRFVEAGREDAALLEQLRHAARQWDARGRPPGLLWRGETVRDARRWRDRQRGALPAPVDAFLQATLAEADRAGRRRRRAVIGAFALLLLLVIAAGVALIWIRRAEQEAHRQTAAARRAERRIKAQLKVIRDKERQRQDAEKTARRATDRATRGERSLATTRKKLALSYADLQQALRKARQAQREAEANRTKAEAASQRALLEAKKARAAADQVRKLADAERQARSRAEKLLAAEKARVKRLRLQLLRKKMATDLK